MRDVTTLLDQVRVWVEAEAAIDGLLLVGSQARGTARPDSDIDLVILTATPAEYLQTRDWLHRFGEVTEVTHEDWGVLQSLRVFYADGVEVEYGIAPPLWADINPVDAGTHRVISDGARILFDRTGRLAMLLQVVQSRPPDAALVVQAALTPETVSRLLRNVALLLENNYLLPERLPELLKMLEKLSPAGAADPASLAATLTASLYRLTGDGHLSLIYDPPFAEKLKRFQNNPALPSVDDHDPGADPQENRTPGGIRTVQWLTGNIGYLDIRDFMASPAAGQRITAALQLLAGCEALIVDLRHNTGGEISMIQWFASSLVEASACLLYVYDDPRSGFQHQVWTDPLVPGPHFPRTPVYVLVSRSTFSAAEAVAYALQTMGRAVVIGEATGGGAYLSESHAAGYGFVLNIPVARPMHPITGTHWQDTGVIPDIRASTEDALAIAHLHALQTAYKAQHNAVQQSQKPGQFERLQRVEWDLTSVRARYQPPMVSGEHLAGLAGDYGDEGRRIIFEDGQLWMQFQHSLTRLFPVTEMIFRPVEHDELQLEFVRHRGTDHAGQIVDLVLTRRDPPGQRVVRKIQSSSRG